MNFKMSYLNSNCYKSNKTILFIALARIVNTKTVVNVYINLMIVTLDIGVFICLEVGYIKNYVRNLLIQSISQSISNSYIFFFFFFFRSSLVCLLKPVLKMEQTSWNQSLN